MTFTDPKTGAKVDIGSNTGAGYVPKRFSALSGSQGRQFALRGTGRKSNGFWLTMTTNDSSDKVVSFYKTELTKNGWTVDSTFTANDMNTPGNIERYVERVAFDGGKLS